MNEIMRKRNLSLPSHLSYYNSCVVDDGHYEKFFLEIPSMDTLPEIRIYRSPSRRGTLKGDIAPSRNGSVSVCNGSVSRNHYLSVRDHQHGHASHDTGIPRRRSSIALRAAMAVENVARRMSVPGFNIDRIEEDLDKEIKEEEEKNENVTGIRQILQNSCEDILHSKKVLLVIVLLNIIDCLLVLAGLILDINYIKEMLHDTKALMRKFTTALQHRFPSVFNSLSVYHLHQYYNRILKNFQSNCSVTNNVSHSITLPNITSGQFNKQSDKNEFTTEDLPSFLTYQHSSHDIATDVAHGLHKASIFILSLLTILVLLKVFCYGKNVFKRKIETFDGIIVIASFVLDIVFIKGLTVYPLDETVQILAFLMPWRVIRVANSLVMAVLDQKHLQLKMVYKEKKMTEEKLESTNDHFKYQQEIVEALRLLCETEGIPSFKVLKAISSCESPNKKEKKIGSLKKKFTRKVNCLGSGVDRSSCPYGNIPDMNEHTLEHLHRIANNANFKSTFEDVNEAPDSDADSGSSSLLDNHYNET